jgi:hypothetical protein
LRGLCIVAEQKFYGYARVSTNLARTNALALNDIEINRTERVALPLAAGSEHFALIGSQVNNAGATIEK